MILIAIIWLGLAVATGAAARSRGRDPIGWFVLAVIISPLLALILLMAFRSKPVGASKLCQFCRSQVAADATVCPHCQRDIDTTELIESRARQLDQSDRRRARTGLAVVGCFFLLIVIAAVAKSYGQ